MSKKEEIKDHLNYIQCNLNAPKNQKNSFGKYKYRSNEDILEALKPLLNETGCTFTQTDEIICVADRVYVVATSTLMHRAQVLGFSKGYAREPHTKKGMDESQITGTASSYARKYSANGLFAIDDNKDADTDEVANQAKNAPPIQAKKPRVPHEEHIKTVKQSMDGADSVNKMKIIARDAYAYFKDWGAQEQMTMVQSHVETLEKNIAS